MQFDGKYNEFEEKFIFTVRRFDKAIKTFIVL